MGENDVEVGEQVLAAVEQILLDFVLDAARRMGLVHLFALGERLAQLGHRPVEMLQPQVRRSPQ